MAENTQTRGTTTCTLANYEELVKSLNGMSGVDAEKVIRQCTQDAKTRAQAWVSAGACEVYTIKKAEIKAALDGKGKGNGKLNVKGNLVDSVALVYKGRPLTPTHFKMKPIQRKPKPYRVSEEVFKGQRKNLPPDVFLTSVRGGPELPFQRTSDRRYPIESKKTTSIPQMIENEKVQPLIQQNIDEGLSKRLENHVKQMLAKTVT